MPAKWPLLIEHADSLWKQSLPRERKNYSQDFMSGKRSQTWVHKLVVFGTSKLGDQNWISFWVPSWNFLVIRSSKELKLVGSSKNLTKIESVGSSREKFIENWQTGKNRLGFGWFWGSTPVMKEILSDIFQFQPSTSSIYSLNCPLKSLINCVLRVCRILNRTVLF